MLSKPVILITGANGQLGREFNKISSSFSKYEFIFLGKEELSIHNKSLVQGSFQKYHPQFLINCAAYTAVDKAETEKDLAYQVNAQATGILAAVCKENDTRFIHISTDYVFDGNGSSPYKETDPADPQGIYGASKLQGEQLALQFNSSSLIIRTSWVYSEFGKNFVKTMLRLMAERPSVNVVNDQVGSPTYAADLAEAIMQIISSNQWQPGIFHYSNTGNISWFDFAVAIKEITGSGCGVNPIPSSQYPTPAKRPGYSVFNTSKIVTAFGIKIKDWRTSLSVCLSKIST